MESLIDLSEKKYKENPYYGIRFMIAEYDDEELLIDEDRVSFENPASYMEHGETFSVQDIFIDGKKVGNLLESFEGGLLSPMIQSYEIFLADCSEKEKMNTFINNFKDNIHFVEFDEYCAFRFATLNQMIDYLGIR